MRNGTGSKLQCQPPPERGNECSSMKRLSRQSGYLAILLGVALGGSAAGQETTPLRTRNLSPMVAVFGLPTWETGLEAHSSEFAIVAEMASHYRLSGRGE